MTKQEQLRINQYAAEMLGLKCHCDGEDVFFHISDSDGSDACLQSFDIFNSTADLVRTVKYLGEKHGIGILTRGTGYWYAESHKFSSYDCPTYEEAVADAVVFVVTGRVEE